MEELTKEFNGKIQSIKFSLDKNEEERSDIKTRSAVDVKIAGRSHSERIIMELKFANGESHERVTMGERTRDISKESGQKGFNSNTTSGN